MKTLILIIGSFIPFMFGCHSDDAPPGSLHHSPTGKVNLKIGDTTIIVDFSLSVDMKNMMDFTGEITNVKTLEDLISYYNTLRPSFNPSYYSYPDKADYRFAKVEYLLAQECFQSDCSSETRREVLLIAIDKQRKKYSELYTLPIYSIRTGAFLIGLILLIEGDNSFIQSLTSDVGMKKMLACLYNNIGFTKEESNTLVLYAEKFLSNQ